MDKRGISELIATVLIIGFTVALAAIIIIWGGRFVGDTQSDVDRQTKIGLSCSKLDFKIDTITCGGAGSCTAGTCIADIDCGTSGGNCDTVSGSCTTGVCTADAECGGATAGGNCAMQVTAVNVINEGTEDIAGFYVRTTNVNGNVGVDSSTTITPNPISGLASGRVTGIGTVAAEQASAPLTQLELIAVALVDDIPEVCSAVVETRTNPCI